MGGAAGRRALAPGAARAGRGLPGAAVQVCAALPQQSQPADHTRAGSVAICARRKSARQALSSSALRAAAPHGRLPHDVPHSIQRASSHSSTNQFRPLVPQARAARSDIRLPAGSELAIYAPGATADRTRCAGGCMLVSALDVPATHRLTTAPMTGAAPATAEPSPATGAFGLRLPASQVSLSV